MPRRNSNQADDVRPPSRVAICTRPAEPGELVSLTRHSGNGPVAGFDVIILAWDPRRGNWAVHQGWR